VDDGEGIIEDVRNRRVVRRLGSGIVRERAGFLTRREVVMDDAQIRFENGGAERALRDLAVPSCAPSKEIAERGHRDARFRVYPGLGPCDSV
jgi:hypothetical protein